MTESRSFATGSVIGLLLPLQFPVDFASCPTDVICTMTDGDKRRGLLLPSGCMDLLHALSSWVSLRCHDIVTKVQNYRFAGCRIRSFTFILEAS
jgi:hypothetical protein